LKRLQRKESKPAVTPLRPEPTKLIEAPEELENLIDEISELVTQLDETSATNRARGVTLIRLKKTNSRRVMQVLNDVLDQ
jgi:hypothetical protein